MSFFLWLILMHRRLDATCAKEDKTSCRLADCTECVFCPCFPNVAYVIVFTEV